MIDLDSAIAVVGFDGRFPGAADPERWWAQLRDGRCGLTRFTAEELVAAGVPAADVADPFYVPVRGAVPGVDLFDADLFGMTPREAELTDPQQRLLLETTRTALEHAGYAPRGRDQRVGVFVGASTSRYLTEHLAGLAGEVGELALSVGNDPAFLATRIAYLLDLHGPALTVATACSTSLVAVHLACQSLLSGDSELAVAGGASVPLPLVGGYRHTPNGVLSATGAVRSFAADADGTVPGDGAAVVVLKHAEAALAEGDTVYALIRGSAVNNDGAAKLGFTAPGVDGQADVIAQAQRVAGVGPDEISYVEAHATATRMGDPVEVAALTEAFRRGTRRTGYCALGAVKPNVGHLDAAAGVAGLLKTVLALHHERIPPTIGVTAPNPEIDFAGSPFAVVTEPTPWPQETGRPRTAGVSSFGFGGTNAHVVLGEAPAPMTPPAPPLRRPVLIPLSARTPAALDTLIERTAPHLTGPHPLPDVAHTLQAGRGAFEHRAAVAVDPVDGDAAGARAALLSSARAARPASTVVALFGGQGTLRPGMLRELHDRYPVLAAGLDRCAAAVAGDLDVDLRDVLCGTADPPHARQVALLAAQLALADLVRSLGIEPAAVLGHSLGEYAAAAVAGALTPEEALPLVLRRSRAFDGLPAGAMLLVGARPDEIEARLPERVWCSGTHGPDTVAVAGDPGAVAALRAVLRADGIAATPVAVDHAFHTPAVGPALDGLRAAVSVPYRPLRLPVIAGRDGAVLAPGTVLTPEHWVRHARDPVRLDAAARAALALPDAVFLEMGAASGMVDVVRRAAGGTRTAAFALGGRDGMCGERALLAAVAGCWTAGVAVDFAALPAAAPRRVPLPTYPYQRRRHWVDTVTPSQQTPPRPPEVTTPPEPGDGTTERVRRIWAELLGVPDADLPEVGGTSLTTIQLLTRLRDEFGVRIPLSDLFDAPTIDDVADLVRDRLASR